MMQRRQPDGTDLVGLVGVSPTLADLLRRQLGVTSRRQLHEHGLSGRAVRATVSRGTWRAFGDNVIVVDNAPLSARQREWAAVLLVEKMCALAGATAAAAAGLRGFESDRVHIVVPHDTHVRAPAWVKLHESRRFHAADIEHSGGPPRTSLARSAVDLAAWSTYPRRACAVLCAAVQQRLTTAQRLTAELDIAGRVRHAAIMREILGDIGGGGHTLAEIDLAPLLRRAGLPRPRRQQLRREPNGKVRYLDVEVDLPNGTLLAIEIDGSGHDDPSVSWDDDDRQNEVVISGTPMLRFASVRVRLDKQRVIDQLTRMRLAYS